MASRLSGVKREIGQERRAVGIRIENLDVDGQGRFVRVKKNSSQGREGLPSASTDEIIMRLLKGRFKHGET
jgi:hypothetical protein